VSRLFHSIVVVGAGLSASGCGSGEKTGSAGAGGGASGAGGNESAGGGVQTEGGIGINGSGGNHGETTVRLELEAGVDLTGLGTFSQWSCTVGARCTVVLVDSQNYLPAEALSEPCPSDMNRPRTAADCSGNEWFTCQLAVWNEQPIAVNCACVAETDAGCDLEGCYDSKLGGFATCWEHSKLCGCAFTAILIK